MIQSAGLWIMKDVHLAVKHEQYLCLCAGQLSVSVAYGSSELYREMCWCGIETHTVCGFCCLQSAVCIIFPFSQSGFVPQALENTQEIESR
jgi:hypothetical protein